MPGRGAKALKSRLAEYAKTTKANPLLACGKDRLFMSLALTSNLDYLLRCEQRW